MQVKVVSEYRRQTAVAALRTVFRKYFPLDLPDRPIHMADCAESSLKDALPGYHAHVSVTRIGTGNGNGGQH